MNFHNWDHITVGGTIFDLAGDFDAFLGVFAKDLFERTVPIWGEVGLSKDNDEFKGLVDNLDPSLGDLLDFLGVFALDLFKETWEIFNDPLLVCLVSIGEKSGGWIMVIGLLGGDFGTSELLINVSPTIVSRSYSSFDATVGLKKLLQSPILNNFSAVRFFNVCFQSSL